MNLPLSFADSWRILFWFSLVLESSVLQAGQPGTPRAQGMLLAQLFKRMACSGRAFWTQEISDVFPVACTIVFEILRKEKLGLNQVQDRSVKKMENIEIFL